MLKCRLGQNVAWEAHEKAAPLILELKKKDFEIIGLEQNKKSIDYKKIKPVGDLALVLGSEVDGIKSTTLSLCDKVVEIPMQGKKESLNVSVAAGIALYRILNL